MAIKTFNSGEVLTASDTNTYLANGGLQVVTPTSVSGGTLSAAKTTIGTTQSTVTLNGVFSSTYDNYLIQIYGYSVSADGSVLWMTINGSTGTTYQSVGYYMAYGSTTLNGIGAAATANGFRLAENSSTGYGTVQVNLYRPGVAAATTFSSVSQNAGYANQYQGKDTNAAASANFTLSLSSGTISSGTIMVYGYRLG